MCVLTHLLAYFACFTACCRVTTYTHLLLTHFPRLDQDPHAWHDADADADDDNADADADDDTDADDADANADADAETPVEADAATTRPSAPDRSPLPGGLPVVPLLRSSL